MIERLRIQNFKVFRDVEFPLQPLTVIVGPNASGKSSVLQALECLTRWVTGGEQLPLRILQRHGSDRPLVLMPYIGKYSWRYGIEEESRFINGAPANAPAPERVAAAFRGRRLAFEPRKLAAPSYFHPEDLPPQLNDDGSGLASVISDLKQGHDERFQNLIKQLHSVVGNVEGVRTKSATVTLIEPEEEGREGVLRRRRYSGSEILLDFKGAREVPASQVSEGTLLTLGLLVVLNGPTPPNLLLLDDIERGLHPRAMGELIGQLRLLQEQNTNLQIVATSHSPYFLDFLKHEEILLTSLDEDGSAHVASMTSHPDFEKWKDLLAPGELWATVGEKWVGREKGQKETEP